jgi:hypothetical protein
MIMLLCVCCPTILPFVRPDTAFFFSSLLLLAYHNYPLAADGKCIDCVMEQFLI